MFTKRRVWLGSFAQTESSDLSEDARKKINAMRDYCFRFVIMREMVPLPIKAVPKDVPRYLLGPKPDLVALVPFIIDRLVPSDAADSPDEHFQRLRASIDSCKSPSERTIDAATIMLNEIAENFGYRSVNLLVNSAFHWNPYHPPTRLRRAAELLIGFETGNADDVFQAGLILGTLYREQKWLDVVVDTGPAFLASLGVEEENSNTQMLAFARSLRDLTKLPGRPAVIVLTHPIKGAASKEQLVPRGGGGLLAEVDGNLCIELNDDRTCATLHWTGKFRGPSFEPIPFVLETTTCERLRDARGRKLWSVIVKVGDDNAAENVERARREDENDLLVALLCKPGLSLAAYAELLGWRTGQGEPAKMRVQRRLKALEEAGLAKAVRGKWRLTRHGREEAETIEREART